MEDPLGHLLYLIVVVAILIHIRSEARRIGESWGHLIIPTIFFWWLVYPLWLFLWPGMHRPSRRGKDPETYLAMTWARRRVDRLGKRNHS
jgi:hypothetical protein